MGKNKLVEEPKRPKRKCTMRAELERELLELGICLGPSKEEDTTPAPQHRDRDKSDPESIFIRDIEQYAYGEETVHPAW